VAHEEKVKWPIQQLISRKQEEDTEEVVEASGKPQEHRGGDGLHCEPEDGEASVMRKGDPEDLIDFQEEMRRDQLKISNTARREERKSQVSRWERRR
jgi:hypothetical protein